MSLTVNSTNFSPTTNPVSSSSSHSRKRKEMSSDLEQSKWSFTYSDIRTVSEMVEEQFCTDITILVMEYLNIPYCKRTLEEQYEALASPLTNVVWFEDFFTCNAEGFKTEAVNPYSEFDMLHLVRMIRWENNQPDRQNRIVVFQPEKVIVNGEETPLSVDLIELLAKKSKCHQGKFDFVVDDFTAEQRNAPIGPACCYSISFTVHEETRYKPFKEQEKIIQNEGDQVPSIAQASLATLGWYAKSGGYIYGLNPPTYTWTTSFASDGERLFIGGFHWTGLDVGTSIILSNCGKVGAGSVRELSNILK